MHKSRFLIFFPEISLTTWRAGLPTALSASSWFSSWAPFKAHCLRLQCNDLIPVDPGSEQHLFSVAVLIMDQHWWKGGGGNMRWWRRADLQCSPNKALAEPAGAQVQVCPLRAVLGRTGMTGLSTRSSSTLWLWVSMRETCPRAKGHSAAEASLRELPSHHPQPPHPDWAARPSWKGCGRQVTDPTVSSVTPPCPGGTSQLLLPGELSTERSQDRPWPPVLHLMLGIPTRARCHLCWAVGFLDRGTKVLVPEGLEPRQPSCTSFGENKSLGWHTSYPSLTGLIRAFLSLLNMRVIMVMPSFLAWGAKAAAVAYSLTGFFLVPWQMCAAFREQH